MAEESDAAACAGEGDETGIGGEAFEKGDEARAIAGIDLPSTVEALNDQGRGGLAWTDVENGAAGGHEAIGLAGDDGAEGFRFLGDETNVAGPGEFVAGPITEKGDVGVGIIVGAEGFEGFALRAGSHKGEVEAAIGAEVVDCRAERIDVVGEAEIAPIEDPQRAGGGEREGLNFGAVRPVIGDVDALWGNAAADQTLAHAFAEGDNAIRLTTGVVERSAHEAGTPGAGVKDTEIDGDIGIEVHFPDEVAGTEDGLEKTTDDAERGGGGEGEDEVRPGAEETAVESAGEEGGVREGARHEAAAEGDVGSADDLDGRRIEGIGLDIGVGTAAADGADGVALGSEAASQIREELAGGRRVRVEELV